MFTRSHGRPFTESINALRSKGYRFQDLSVRSDEARSTAWFNNLVNSEDPWAVAPPSDRTWQGLARLLGITEQHLRELVAAALVNTAVTLGSLNRPEDEMAVYDQVEDCYRHDPTPAIRAQVAAALVNATTSQPGWRDSERLAGMAYLKTTFAAEFLDEEKELGKTALMNSEHAARLLNEMIANLKQISDAIESQDAATLQAILEEAKTRREQWLSHRLEADWGSYPKESTLSATDSITGLFGGRLRKKK